MIREIGSVYSEVKFVEDRIYIRMDDVDYAVQGEWIKVTYKVTKKGDVIIGATLATQQEIERAKKVDLYVELDKEIQEEWNKLKDNAKELKYKAKNKFNELKEKFQNKKR